MNSGRLRLIFKLQRKRPEFIDRILEVAARFFRDAPHGGSEQQIVRRLFKKIFRPERQPVERPFGAAPFRRRDGKRLALFDDGARQRIEKRLGGQRDERGL